MDTWQPWYCSKLSSLKEDRIFTSTFSLTLCKAVSKHVTNGINGTNGYSIGRDFNYATLISSSQVALRQSSCLRPIFAISALR